ncbi:MAG: VOC family protein [Thermoplasmata archaeon]|nr:VOC family protein [Thermoplasmata archaeon]
MTNPAAGGRFYGPMIVCDDFAGTFRFYRETLGLETGVDGSPPWAEFQSEGVRLVLLDRGFWETVHGPGAGPGPGRGPVAFAVQVSDVDTMYERLRGVGTPFETPPTDRPMMGVRSAMLRDPEGTLVELTTQLRTPPKPQKATRGRSPRNDRSA